MLSPVRVERSVLVAAVRLEREVAELHCAALLLERTDDVEKIVREFVQGSVFRGHLDVIPHEAFHIRRHQTAGGSLDRRELTHHLVAAGLVFAFFLEEGSNGLELSDQAIHS